MLDTLKVLHQKIDALPEEAKLALWEYVDFLSSKYQASSENTESQELVKQLLLKRYEKLMVNPEKTTLIKDLRNKYKQKYGWDV